MSLVTKAVAARFKIERRGIVHFLVSIRRNGKIGGARLTSDIGVSGAVDGDAIAGVAPTAVEDRIAAASNVGGVKQCGAVGVELGYEDVPQVGGGVGFLIWTLGDRVVRGVSRSSDIGVSGRVDSNGVGPVVCAAAEVGAVGEDGVDYQGFGVVVAAYFEADGVVGLEGELAFDGMTLAVGFLIDDAGLRKAIRPFSPVTSRSPSRVRAELLAPGELEADGFGIGVGGDYEVVFKLSLVAVVDEVDAAIDMAVADFGVCGDIGVPFGGVVAEEVVGYTGELVCAFDAGVGYVGAERDASGWCRFWRTFPCRG